MKLKKEVKEEKKTDLKEETKAEKKKTSKIKSKVLKTVKRHPKKAENDEITTNVNFNLLEVIIIILITGVIVSIISGLIVYNNYSKIKFNKDTNETIPPHDLDELIENYNIIINDYVNDVNKEELLDAAISAMYSHLGDAYSTYMTPDETDTLSDQLDGEYEGIGVEIVTLVDKDGNNLTLINDIFKGSPADRAGMKVGDVFVKIDDIELKDKDASYIADYIKKGNKTSFVVVISRDGKEKTLNLEREHVVIDSVSSETFDNIGYIKVETFAQNTDTLVKNEINKFDPKVDRLIIDLRDNTGGLLSQAETLSDLFVEKGKNIYQIKDKNGVVTSHKAENDVYKQYNKIVLLVNENSASAAEIFALALKESAGATIVGNKTFGKGTVQETRRLDSGAMVKYTTSYWLSPNGNSINNEGIQPDVLEANADKQLDAAKKAVK